MRITEQVYLVGGGNYGISHPGDCNVYLVDCGSSRVLIDAGCGMYADGIIDNIRKAGFDPLSVEVIVCTHSHWDHACGCSDLKAKLKAKIAGHPGCDYELREGLWQNTAVMASGVTPPEPTRLDIGLEHGQKIKWGDVQFEVLFTPGHSPDSICLCAHTSDRRVMFTGDTVLGEASIGTCTMHTDFPALKESIEFLIDYGVDTLFPGHRTFSLRYGLSQMKHIKGILTGMWGGVIAGPTPFFPTWWVVNHPELVERQRTGQAPYGG